MTTGQFRILKKSAAFGKCEILPEVFFGAVTWRAKSPGCFLELERVGPAPETLDQGRNYKVYSKDESCEKNLGDQVTLNLNNSCCPFPENRCSLLPFIHIVKENDNGRTYACEDKSIWWVDHNLINRVKLLTGGKFPPMRTATPGISPKQEKK